MSTGSGRSRSRRGPATVHAASLLSLQLWAISELRGVLPPLGETARAARLVFLGLVTAIMVAMVLSYPLGAFIRQRALATLAAYVVLACSALCLAEKWTAIEAAYYATASLTTVGCRDLVVRSFTGKVVASTLSIVGPLAAALFWRDNARAQSASQHHQSVKEAATGRSGRGWPSSSSTAGGGGYSQSAKLLQAEEQQARVADAVWAFVGVLMVLVSCATVFLRSSRGDERHLGGQGGGSPRTVLNAVHSALLTMTTVGPAAPPFMSILSPAARALLIPLMLLGALIFSRAMWAVVDVLSPPLVGVGPSAGGGGGGGSPSVSPPPVLSRLEDGGVRGSGDGFKPPGSGHRRGLSQGSGGGGGDVAVASCPVCAATAGAAGSQTPTQQQHLRGAWNGGGVGTSFGDQQQQPLSAEQVGRADQSGMVSPAVSASRAAPPTPTATATATLIEDGEDETDDGEEEDDGWVSEDESTVQRSSMHASTTTPTTAEVEDKGTDNHLGGGGGGGGGGTDVVDPTAGVVAYDGIAAAAAAAQKDPLVFGRPGGGGGGGSDAVIDLDAAPSVRRSWSSGGVWRGEMSPEEQAEQAAAAAAAAASAEALQQRRAAAAARFRARQLDANQAAREAEEENEGREEEEAEERDGEGEVGNDARYSHQPSLASIGEGDEEDDDEEESSDYDSEGKGNKKHSSGSSSSARRQRAGQPRAVEAAGGGAVTEEEKARTADEFIVKRLLNQGKLGRMEAAQMMLEFEQFGQVDVRRKGAREGSGSGNGGGGEDRDTHAKGREEVEQSAREEANEDGDEDEDDSAMAPPDLAKLVGGDTATPQAPAAAVVANAPVVVGGLRGGGGGRGGRAAPLGTPHLRAGSNGSGARPTVGGAQQPPPPPPQQQQQQQEQQHLEAENQQERREEEEYERQQEREEGQPTSAGVPVANAEEEVFAATRTPSIDYDSLAPPGV